MKSLASPRRTTAATTPAAKTASTSRAIALVLLTSIGGLAVAGGATAQTLVQYDPVGGPHQSAVPLAPTTVASSVTVSDLSQIGFVGAWFNSNVWPVGQLGAASPNLDPNQYVTFDVTPNTAIQYLTLSYSRRSYLAEGNQQAAVRTSLDNFAADLALVTGLNPQGLEQIVFDVSSLPPSPAPITFRIYFFDAPTTGVDWVDLDSSANQGTGLTLTGSDTPLGTSYCGPSIVNSSGLGAVITATGSAAVADNDVLLEAADMPTNQFGYFLNSMTQAQTFPVPNSQGVLCVGGAIGRYNGNVFNTGATGTGSLQLDLPNTPTPTGTVAIASGETWNFTCWFRDNNPGPTSNFTDGFEIMFQ